MKKKSNQKNKLDLTGIMPSGNIKVDYEVAKNNENLTAGLIKKKIEKLISDNNYTAED